MTHGVNGIGVAIVHLVWRHQTEAAMVVVALVPVEEAGGEGLGIFDAAEAFREGRLILQGFEVGSRRRDCRSRCVGRLCERGDAKVSQ